MTKSNEGLHIFYEISESIAKETKNKFKLKSNQFAVHAMGYSGAIEIPDVEGLKYLAKTQGYEFHSFGALMIKISYRGFKAMVNQPFILTNKNGRVFIFMAESGPDVAMNPKKMAATRVGLSIIKHVLMRLFDHFKEKGIRMHMCSTKVPLSSLHYYIVPLS